MIRFTMCAVAFVATIATASPFRFERAVTPGGTGPNRLEVDVDLLSGSKPGLEDLRLFDSSNREVGYLLVAPPEKGPQWIAGSVLPIATTKTTSGFEVDLRSAREIDRLRLSNLSAPHLKAVRVEGSGDRAHWTLLGDATVFNLPDQNLRHNEVAFEPGQYRYLRVTWDDRASARIRGTPFAEARIHGSGGPPEPLRFGVPFRQAARVPDKSRYRIDLPGPSLPLDAIEVQVSSGDVFRNATISEPRLTDTEIVPVPLGSSRLRRAQRDGGVAADLTIPIRGPSGRELVLTVDDDNNPPLPITAIIARAEPQPSNSPEVTASGVRQQMPLRLTRTSTSVISLFAPTALGWVGAVTALIFVDDWTKSTAWTIFVAAFFLIGISVSVYMAYLYSKDKGRHGALALCAVFNLWGWLFLWALADRARSLEGTFG